MNNPPTPQKKRTTTRMSGQAQRKEPRSGSQAKEASVGVLTKDDILFHGIICENACDARYEAASYDMCLKNEYIKPKKDGNGTTETCIPKKGGPLLTIKAYSNAIVATHEVLKLPTNVIGRFNLRIKIALQGLFVQMGTQIEPGYHGRLFALIHNISSEDVHINLESEPFFTAEFLYIGKNAVVANEDRHKYLEFHDIFRTDTKFIKGSLSNVVDDVQADIKFALNTSNSAMASSVEAEKLLGRATGNRNLIYTGVIALVVTLVGSAIAPILIGWTIDYYKDSQVKDAVDVRFSLIKSGVNELKTRFSDDVTQFEAKVKMLEAEVEQLRSLTAAVSAKAKAASPTEPVQAAQTPTVHEGQ